jgi:hypothetical protein
MHLALRVLLALSSALSVPTASATTADEAAVLEDQKAVAIGQSLLEAIRQRRFDEVVKRASFPVDVVRTVYSKDCERSQDERTTVREAGALRPFLGSLAASLERHAKAEIRTQSTDSGHQGGMTYEVGLRTADKCAKLLAVAVRLDGTLAGLRVEALEALEEVEKAPQWVVSILDALVRDPAAKLKKYVRFPVEVRSSSYRTGEAGACSLRLKTTSAGSMKDLARPLEAVQAAVKAKGSPTQLNEKGWWGIALDGDCEHVWAVRLDPKDHKLTGLWGDFEA